MYLLGTRLDGTLFEEEIYEEKKKKHNRYRKVKKSEKVVLISLVKKRMQVLTLLGNIHQENTIREHFCHTLDKLTIDVFLSFHKMSEKLMALIFDMQ